MTERACPFCTPDAERVFYRGERVFGLWDAFPVSDGHALIVTKRHVAAWFDASRDEQAELLSALAIAREAISTKHQPDGFNIGVNVGEAAGQTVPHLHVHLIPRYKNDVVDPRGGVRHVIPASASYLIPTDADPDRVADASPLPLANTHSSPLVRGGSHEDPLLPYLLDHLDHARRADILASFILESGVELLFEHLRDLVDSKRSKGRQGRVRILTGDYLGITGLPRRSLGEGGTPTRSCACSISRKKRPIDSTSASSSREAGAFTLRPISSTEASLRSATA